MASQGASGAPAEAAAAAAAAAAARDSRTLVVPHPQQGTQHFCIEYPGYVGDEAKVLETLGGLEGIARQLQENSRQLALRLRPGDRNCHAAYGTREPSRRLLLRLSRPAPADGGGAAAGTSAAAAAAGGAASSWEAEVVAVLPHTYKFSTPADYQYIALDSRPVEEQGLDQQQGSNPPGFQQQPLLCPPPLFAKQPQFDYAFRGHLASAAAAAGGKETGAGGAAVAGRGKKSGHGVMASYYDTEVPAPLPESQLAAAAAAHPDTLHLLRQLLAERPIWPAAALAEAAAAAAAGGASSSGGSGGAGGRLALDDLLPRLCYKFRNGPWKNAWTRRGFDPRAAPAALQWQCFEYHLPSDWYAKIAEHKKAAALSRDQQQQQQQQQSSGSGSGGAAAAGEGLPPLAGDAYSRLLRFEAVPSTQSCSLQLGGLQDSVIQGLLADPANQAQHCSDTSGWLASAAYDAIKRRIKERFQAVLDGTPIQDNGRPAPAARAGRQQQPQRPQRERQQGTALMQVDAAAAGAAGAAGTAAAATAAASPMEVDALAQQAQQQLRLQLPGQGPAAAAAAAAAAAGPEAGLHILPTGLMASLHDYLAAQLPEGEGQEDEEEDEEDGEDEGEEGEEGSEEEEEGGGAPSQGG